MTILSLSRRTLFAAAAGALAAPALLSRATFAQAATETMQKTSPEMTSLKVGTFSATVIRDGKSVVEAPAKTFGTNQKEEDVAALLQANFLPADKFVNSYAPLLVDTGTDVILFDTGFGEGGREAGNGQLLAGITAAGYTPEQVTLVVLTHMHGDHIGGLMEGGQPAFKNARYAAGEVEFDFWKDTARVGTPAENGHKGVLKNVVPFAEKMTFLKEGSEVVPGITAMEAFGHSPGHLIFNLESEGKRVIVTGDTANHYILSLERPDWQVRFDMDKAKAAATRKRVFDMIATDKVGFVGYHMPFPAVGFVEKIDQGYRYVPKTYQFEL